ncbi:Alcohol dehydrogenase GroES domain protein (plasmid) [Haloterrigena turkmenica DSM 5511]|uniref:Alcohol dehydrogenase GroES domain protein n=1 Tax=Haloterrigena turkmenica (strain ATCC 51198 / DSM 5511 / JCM 9101 / NCIMB 13204 / VKM B-1734 / 4k) TaxID=543526 RepID=D2S1P3_HALTV|nr:alcohol dehydrogenase catalytic domain-containing protein [Haloterrigena turkmenica]ADB63290.1 Alcohol dehydrogenase GroES domain protein [Haloterrigena turkmenica DSM 5511]
MRGLAKTSRSQGAMELIERDRPEPEPDEALIEVDYAGLCGSDAGIYEFESAFERMELPTVIGHEYSGRVVEVGDAVTKFAVGDRVVERPIRGCGDCYQCEIGESNVCQDAVITGVDHDGAYEPYIAVPEDALHPVPDSVEQQHAAMVEPTSIATRAVIQNSRVRAGTRVLVEGPGPIGLLTAQVARAQGGEVVVSGVGQDAEYRLPLAEELGFETLNIADDDLDAVRDELTDGVGYDVVFDTTGHPSGLPSAVDEVRKGGQIVLIGQTGETTMPYSPLVRSEIDLQCSYASKYEDFENALRLIDTGDVDAETFIDDRFSLLDADEAFETFVGGGTCKPVFDVSVLRD